MHGDELMGYTMNAKKEEEDSAEIPLHRMKTQDHFIEAQIQEGDTLQAIALRFYCSVSMTYFIFCKSAFEFLYIISFL